jgi:archaeal cell division control protein 6
MPMFRKVSSSLVKDPRVLDFGYVPDQLVHREGQMKMLSALFSPVLDGPLSQTAFLLGPVGTGKTCLANRFCQDFVAAGKGTKAIEFRFVNCRDKRKNITVMYEVCRAYQPFIGKGYSVSDLLDVLRKDIEKRKIHFVLVLDEVDALLIGDGPDLIYSLTRFDEGRPGQSGSLSLIMISTKNVLNNLDVATMSTFKSSHIIKFGGYSEQELMDIVKQRVALGLYPGVMPIRVMEEIARMASEQGDARRAIELIQFATSFADQEGRSKVAMEDLRKAKASIAKVDIEPFILTLERHKKLTLLGIARALKVRSSITMGEAQQKYEVACEELDEKPRSHTQFWKYIQDLTACGVIDSAQSGRGIQGSTTLISLTELPAKTLIEVLEKDLDLA